MHPRPLLSRRTTLVTGLGTAGLVAAGTGCSLRVPGDASPTASATPGPVQLEPDVQIVIDLVRELRLSVRLLQDIRAEHLRLAPRVSPLIAVQRRHLEVLRQAAPADSLSVGPPATPAVPTGAAAALDQVVETTQALRDACYSGAGRAESGKFARLLAGMGAALSQRLVLDEAPPATVAESASDSTGIAALQAALTGEHAAVYVFGVLVAQTSESVQPKLWADLDAAYVWHRAARDELVRRITSSKQTPVAAAPSYELPNAVADADLVTRAALVTERRVTDTYGTLIAETAGGVRRWAIRSLDESAVRQLRFRGRPEIFPGTGGLDDQDR